MEPLKNFRLFSSVLIILSIVFVGGSPFQHRSLDLHHFKDEEPENVDIYRLPNDVIPVSYELKMVPDLEKFTFAGQVNITVHVQITTDRIILHSKNLTLENVMVLEPEGFAGNAMISISTTHTLDEKNEILIINTASKFKSNKNYIVSIKFRGMFESGFSGFYRASYKADDDQTRWFVATQFEQMDARRAFPCFDEPRFRTPFTIYLAHSEKHIAISNMPSETTDLELPADSMSNGLGYEKFQTTPPMPTYLVAFMVSDFKQLTDQNLDRRIRLIARPNLIQKGQYTLQQATKLLAFFEGYLGIRYPLPKLDVVAVPGFRGGMENWGMPVFDENMAILNYDEYKIFAIAVTTILSHEFAHLWFGDLVSPSWYDYLWLKNGFATYFQFFATAAIEPTWNQEEIFAGVLTQNTLTEDTFFERAITWPNRKLKDIEQSYDEAVSYNKAAILIRMFELMFSSKTFQSALRRYLEDGRQNQHGVAVEKNLFDAFDNQLELDDSVSNLPLHAHASDIMKTWTENIGYPLITITRSYEQGEVNIIQTPYPRRINTSDNRYWDQKWIIPLTFTTKSQLQFSNLQPVHWSFAHKPTRLTGFKKADWILFNLKRAGYYRVNYDAENWQLLIDQLMENHTKIHVLNRAQLIDDVLTLADDKLINCTIAGRLMKYLQKETNIIPWYPVSQWFQKLISRETSNSASLKTLKNQLKSFLEEPLKYFGCPLGSDDGITLLVKIQFLSLSRDLGIKYCADELLQISEKNCDNFNKIPHNLKSAVFSDALLYSDNSRKIVKHLWHNYRRSNEVYEKKHVLEFISWNQIQCNLKRAVKSVANFVLEEGAKETAPKNVFSSDTSTITEIIKFLDESIPSLSNPDEYGIEFLESLLNSIDSKIQTEEQIELVKKLEIKCESLNQTKYSKYVKMVKNVRSNAEKKIMYRIKFMKAVPNECFCYWMKPSRYEKQT